MQNPRFDPLAHVPDPDQRYQVFAFMHGGAPFVQIADVESKTGVIVDLLSALEVARDINDQVVHLLERLGHEQGAMIEPEADGARWQETVWQAN